MPLLTSVLVIVAIVDICQRCATDKRIAFESHRGTIVLSTIETEPKEFDLRNPFNVVVTFTNTGGGIAQNVLGTMQVALVATDGSQPEIAVGMQSEQGAAIDVGSLGKYLLIGIVPGAPILNGGKYLLRLKGGVHYNAYTEPDGTQHPDFTPLCMDVIFDSDTHHIYFAPCHPATEQQTGNGHPSPFPLPH